MGWFKRLLFITGLVCSGFSNASVEISASQPSQTFLGVGVNTYGSCTPMLGGVCPPPTYSYIFWGGAYTSSSLLSPGNDGELLNVASTLQPFETLPRIPGYLPYFLGNNLDGPYTGTFSLGGSLGELDETNFAVVTDGLSIDTVLWIHGPGTFHFNATPNKNYYGVAFGAVGSPIDYTAAISAVPLPSTMLLLLSGLGLAVPLANNRLRAWFGSGVGLSGATN